MDEQDDVYGSLLLVTPCFVVCPAIAISTAENPDISRYDSITPMGPVVSGTNQNSTVISIMSSQSCTPIVRYANDSYFLHLSSIMIRSIQFIEWQKSCYPDYQVLNQRQNITIIVSGCGIPDIDRTFTTFPVSRFIHFYRLWRYP